MIPQNIERDEIVKFISGPTVDPFIINELWQLYPLAILRVRVLSVHRVPTYLQFSLDLHQKEILTLQSDAVMTGDLPKYYRNCYDFYIPANLKEYRPFLDIRIVKLAHQKNKEKVIQSSYGFTRLDLTKCMDELLDGAPLFVAAPTSPTEYFTPKILPDFLKRWRSGGEMGWTSHSSTFSPEASSSPTLLDSWVTTKSVNALAILELRYTKIWPTMRLAPTLPLLQPTKKQKEVKQQPLMRLPKPRPVMVTLSVFWIEVMVEPQFQHKQTEVDPVARAAKAKKKKKKGEESDEESEDDNLLREGEAVESLPLTSRVLIQTNDIKQEELISPPCLFETHQDPALPGEILMNQKRGFFFHQFTFTTDLRSPFAISIVNFRNELEPVDPDYSTHPIPEKVKSEYEFLSSFLISLSSTAQSNSSETPQNKTYLARFIDPLTLLSITFSVSFSFIQSILPNRFNPSNVNKPESNVMNSLMGIECGVYSTTASPNIIDASTYPPIGIVRITSDKVAFWTSRQKDGINANGGNVPQFPTGYSRQSLPFVDVVAALQPRGKLRLTVFLSARVNPLCTHFADPTVGVPPVLSVVLPSYITPLPPASPDILSIFFISNPGWSVTFTAYIHPTIALQQESAISIEFLAPIFESQKHARLRVPQRKTTFKSRSKQLNDVQSILASHTQTRTFLILKAIAFLNLVDDYQSHFAQRHSAATPRCRVIVQDEVTVTSLCSQHYLPIRMDARTVIVPANPNKYRPNQQFVDELGFEELPKLYNPLVYYIPMAKIPITEFSNELIKTTKPLEINRQNESFFVTPKEFMMRDYDQEAKEDGMRKGGFANPAVGLLAASGFDSKTDMKNVRKQDKIRMVKAMQKDRHNTLLHRTEVDLITNKEGDDGNVLSGSQRLKKQKFLLNDAEETHLKMLQNRNRTKQLGSSQDNDSSSSDSEQDDEVELKYLQDEIGHVNQTLAAVSKQNQLLKLHTNVEDAKARMTQLNTDKERTQGELYRIRNILLNVREQKRVVMERMKSLPTESISSQANSGNLKTLYELNEQDKSVATQETALLKALESIDTEQKTIHNHILQAEATLHQNHMIIGGTPFAPPSRQPPSTAQTMSQASQYSYFPPGMYNPQQTSTAQSSNLYQPPLSPPIFRTSHPHNQPHPTASVTSSFIHASSSAHQTRPTTSHPVPTQPPRIHLRPQAPSAPAFYSYTPLPSQPLHTNPPIVSQPTASRLAPLTIP
ncbi:hypothetical protein BLNAU_515 [Blattamonas nauphoetae]|uniref:DUF3668 domain-containing protein n=1 Tax=Blattamonas nauphoetae TaxID=2049346 RepID=A0ABQ9YLH4_9EUKA|nr:hypothetical protein BLNAU_515 [Blattamonas nauphoetae]